MGEVKLKIHETRRELDDDYDIFDQSSASANLFANLRPETVDYRLQTTGHADAFCSRSITKRKTVLRYFQTVSCMVTAVSLFLAPYQYFFKQSQIIFRFNNVADFVYILVMLFRARTTYIVGGIEERNLLKTRNRYQNSIAFVLDLLTLFPLIQLRLPYIEFNESFYTLNRQTIIIRLHYILFYLRK